MTTSLNRRAARTAVRVHPWTYAVLEEAQRVAEASNGVFDITVAALLVRRGLLPAARGRPVPHRSASFRDIRLLSGSRVRFLRPLLLDLGGIAKGFAVDRAIDCLRRSSERAAAPTTLHHLGMAYLAAGRAEDAKAAFTKAKTAARGAGIEDRMMVVWDAGVRGGRITDTRFVEITATSPAKLFGLYPRKGTIAVGSDADIVLWDAKAERTLSARTHHMRVDYNLYEGRKIVGAPKVVMLRGEVKVRDDRFVGAKNKGSFLPRQVVRLDKAGVV